MRPCPKCNALGYLTVFLGRQVACDLCDGDGETDRREYTLLTDGTEQPVAYGLDWWKRR